MNPLFAEFLGSLLRWALTGVAGWLISHGIITPDQSGRFMAGLIIGIVTLGWSLWQKYGNRVLLNTGLAMPKGSSLDDVKDSIDAGIKASATTPSAAAPQLVGTARTL